MNEKELIKICGGATISGSFIQYFTNAIQKVYSMGQDFGGALRRIATGNICPL